MTRISAFLFILLYFLSGGNVIAQQDTINITNLKTGLDFENSWRFAIGDNQQWASPSFNDTSWKKLSKDEIIDLGDPHIYKGIIWYRSSYYADSLLQGTPLALEIQVIGAMDVFIDGYLI